MKKKHEILGSPPFGPPPFEPPPLWPPPFGALPPFRGLNFSRFGPPTFRAPTLSGPHFFWVWAVHPSRSHRSEPPKDCTTHLGQRRFGQSRNWPKSANKDGQSRSQPTHKHTQTHKHKSNSVWPKFGHDPFVNLCEPPPPLFGCRLGVFWGSSGRVFAVSLRGSSECFLGHGRLWPNRLWPILVSEC